MAKHLFEVISGAGLGTQNTSLDRVGHVYEGRTLGQAQQRCFVNAATGNMHLRGHMHSFQFLGFDVEVGYAYNSNDDTWRCSLGKSLAADADSQTVDVTNEDGSKTHFVLDVATQSYIAKGLPGGNQYLVHDADANTWRVTHLESGLFETFDAHGRQTERADLAERKLTFVYDGDGILEKVADTAGRELNFVLAGGQYAVSFTDDAGVHSTLLKTYHFDGHGHILSTDILLGDGTNYTIEYPYNAELHKLESVTQVGTTIVSFAYAADGKVKAVTDGAKRKFKLEYGEGVTKVVAPLGEGDEFATVLHHNPDGSLASIEETQGKTGFEYFDSGCLQTVTYPATSADPDNHPTKNFTYDTHGLVATAEDEMGRVKIFHRDSGTGLCFAEVLVPGTYVQRYVYNAKRQLAFSINAMGCVTLYEYDDDSGNRVSARTQFDTAHPLTNPVTQALTFVEMTTWWGEQDLARTALTKFEPNTHGQNHVVTHHAVLNADGSAAASTSDSVVTYAWNPFGDWENKTIKMDDGEEADSIFVSSREFDGMVRVKKATDAAHNETTTDYVGARTVVKHCEFKDGELKPRLKKTVIADASGLVASELDEDANDNTTHRQTQTQRDVAGRAFKITKPNGQVVYQLHDPQGRLINEVDELGYVTEYRYDNRNHLRTVIRYAEPIANVKAVFDHCESLASIRDAVSYLFGRIGNVYATDDKNRKTITLYNKAGQLRYEIDGERFVTEHRYDKNGNRVCVYRYADALPEAQALVLDASGNLAGTSTDNPENRQHIYFYNAANQLSGEQNGNGYVTEYKLDVAGRCWQQIQYSSPMALNVDFNQARPARVPGKDSVTFFVRDNMGRVTGEIVAVDSIHAYFTKKCYYGNGKLKSQVRYDRCLENYNSDVQKFVLPDIGTYHEDQTISFVYDSHGRVTRKTEEPLGRKTEFVYNEAGKLVERHVIDLQKHDIKRSEYWRYNVYGQQTAHLDLRGGTAVDFIHLVNPSKVEAFWDAHAVFSTIDKTSGLVLCTCDQLNPENKTFFYYDKRGRLVLTVDPRGVVERKYYDAFNCTSKRVYAVVLPAEQMATLVGGFLPVALVTFLDDHLADPLHDSYYQYEFNQCGLEVMLLDPDGFTTEITYNAFRQMQHRLRAVSEGVNFEEGFGYDRCGNGTTHTIDPGVVAHQTVKTYDFHNAVATATDAAGVTTTLGRDLLARQVSTTDAKAQIALCGWDAFGREVTHTDKNGNPTRTEYQTAARKHTVKTHEGRTVETHVNTFDEARSHEDSNGAVVLHAYQSDGKRTSTRSPEGRLHSDFFDLRGRQISSRQPSLVETAFGYDESSDLSAATVDPTGANVTTAIVSDTLGHATLETSAAGIKTALVRDRRGCVKRQITDNPYGPDYVTDLHTDGLKRTVLEIQGTCILPDGPIKADYVVKTTYNEAGLKWQTIVDPDGLKLTTTREYDKAKRLICVTDPRRNKTFTFYDDRGDAQFAVKADGSVCRYDRDDNHNVIRETHFVYKLDITAISIATTTAQILALVAGKSSANDDVKLCRCNGDNQCVFEISANGVVKEFLFDKAGRPSGERAYHHRIQSTDMPTIRGDLKLETVRALLQPNVSLDQFHIVIKDSDDNERFTINGRGAVIETRYDANANKIATIARATVINLTEFMTTGEYTVAAIEAMVTDLASDRITHLIYNTTNHPVYTIDPSLNVTKTIYDADGNLLECIEYATVLRSMPEALTEEAIEAVLEVDEALDEHTVQAFDGNKNVVHRAKGSTAEVKAGEADEEEFVYNGANKLVWGKDPSGMEWETQYDGARRVEYEWTPETDVVVVAPKADNPDHLDREIVRAQLFTHHAYEVEDGIETGKLTKTKGYQVDGADPVITSKVVTTYDVRYRLKTMSQEVRVDDSDAVVDKVGVRSDDVLQTVTATTVYDALGNKVVEIDESGNPLFRCFHSDRQLVYAVDALGFVTYFSRSSFGEPLGIIKYTHSVSDKINLSDPQYLENGITLSVLKDAITETAGEDRTLTQAFDRDGNLLSTTKDEVFCYEVSEGREHTAAKIRPKKSKTWNAFNEETKDDELVSLDGMIKASKHTFRNNNGHVIAVVEPGGYVTLFERNRHGKKTHELQYATELTDAQIIKLREIAVPTFSACQAVCGVVSVYDREYTFTYDAHRRLTSKTLLNVVLQETTVGEDGTPEMHDLPAQDLTTRYAYQDHGRTCVITHPNDSTEIRLTDELGRKAVRQGRERVSSSLREASAAGDAAIHPTIREQTQVTFDANGHKAVLVKSAVTEAGEVDPNTATQTRVNWFDHRGKLLQKQKAGGANQYCSYTATGKPARHYKWVTGWDLSDISEPPRRLNQTRWKYDARDKKTCERWLDLMHGNEYQWHKHVNAFGEVTGEGSDPAKYSIGRQYNQAGHCWFTNEDRGIDTIKFCDARGKETCQLRSKTAGYIAGKTEVDFERLAEESFSTLMRTETRRDVRGNVTAEYQPKFRRMVGPEPIKASIMVAAGFPKDGDHSLYWETTANTNEFMQVAHITLTRGDLPPLIQTLEVQEVNGKYYYVLDVKGMVADVYDYDIAYYFKNPITKVVDVVKQAETKGNGLVIDAPDTAGALNIAVQMIDEATVLITGKTTKIIDGEPTPLVGVALFQGDTEVARVGVNSTSVEGRYIVDLTDMVSGNYTLKPIYTSTALNDPTPIQPPSELVRHPELVSGSSFAGTVPYEGADDEDDGYVFVAQPASVSVNDYENSDDADEEGGFTLVAPPVAEPSLRAERSNPSAVAPIEMQLVQTTLGAHFGSASGTERVTDFQYGFTNNLTWSNLPPGISSLVGKMSQVSGMYVEVPRLTFHGFETEEFSPANGSHDFSYTHNQPIESMELYAMGARDELFYIGAPENPTLPGKNKVPPYVYISLDGRRMDFVSIFDSNASVIKTLRLEPWLDGFKRVDVSSLENVSETKFEVFSLSTAQDDSIADITLLTSHLEPQFTVKTIILPSFEFKPTLRTMGGTTGYMMDHVFELPSSLSRSVVGLTYLLMGQIQIENFIGNDYNARITVGGYANTISNLSIKLNIDGEWVQVISSDPDRVEKDSALLGKAWFSGKVVYLSNIPSETANIVFQYYLDNGDPRVDDWIELSPDKGQKVGDTAYVFDVKSLGVGQFKYRMQLLDANNQPIVVDDPALVRDADGWITGTVTLKADPAAQLTAVNSDAFELVSPLQKTKKDRWGNTVSVSTVVDAETTDDDELDKCTHKRHFNKMNGCVEELSPVVDAVDDHGHTVSDMRQQTCYGFNAMGEDIGRRTHKGGVVAKARNLAGDVTRVTRAANKAFVDFEHDGFGRETAEITPVEPTAEVPNPEGNRATTCWDLDDHIDSETDARGWKTEFTRNEDGDEIAVTNGENETRRFDVDERRRTVRTIESTGEFTTQEFHPRTDELVKRSTGDDLPNIDGKGRIGDESWVRDDFGVLLVHTDSGDAVMSYDGDAEGKHKRDGLRNVTAVVTTAAKGHHGTQHVWGKKDEPEEPIPEKHIIFKYDEGGHLIEANDEGCNTTSYYKIDTDGRRRGERFKGRDGVVVQDTLIEHDRMGRVVKVQDIRVHVTYEFDENGNRRHTSALYFPYNLETMTKEEGISIEAADLWFKYDADDLIIVDRGVKDEDGNIVIAKGKGTELSYDEAGQRFTETTIDKDGKKVTKTLAYYDNGQLHTLIGDDGSSITCDYDRAKRRTGYTDGNKHTSTGYYPNGRVHHQVEYEDGKQKSESNFGPFSNSGLVLHEDDYAPNSGDPDDEDHLDSSFVGFDGPRISSMSGSRTVHGGLNPTYATVRVTRDANGNYQTVDGALTEDEGFRWIQANHEGRIVVKDSGKGRELYIYGPEGEVIAWIGGLPSDPTSSNVPTKVNFDPLFHAVCKNWPPAGPAMYVVREGDTFKSIARMLYGDPSRAFAIAHQLGYSETDTPPIGRTIRVTETVQADRHNRAGSYAAYNPSQLRGPLRPNIPAPPIKPPHHSVWGMFIEFAIAAIAMIAAPELAAALEGVMGTLLADVLAYSAVLGTANIAEQEVGVISGMQKDIDWSGVGRAYEMGAIEGLTMAELHVPQHMVGSPAAETGLSFQTQMELSLLMNLQTQAFFMATGQQRNFDWNSLERAAAQGVINYADSQLAGLVHNRMAANLVGDVFGVTASNAVASLYPHHHFDVESTVAQILGTFVGQTLAYEGLSYVARVSKAHPEKDSLSQAAYQKYSWRAAAYRDFNRSQLVANSAAASRATTAGLAAGAVHTSGTGMSFSSEVSGLFDQANVLATFASLGAVGSEDASLVSRFSAGRAANDSGSWMQRTWLATVGSVHSFMRSQLEYDLTHRPTTMRGWKDLGVGIGKGLDHLLISTAAMLLDESLNLTLGKVVGDLAAPMINHEERTLIAQTPYSNVEQQAGGIFIGVGSLFLPGGADTRLAEFAEELELGLGAAGQKLLPGGTSLLEGDAAALSVSSRIGGFIHFSRRAAARNFYARGGWSPSKIDSHLDGIDFTNSVDEVTIPRGTIMGQYQLPGYPIGNYFTEIGAVRGRLGIYTSGRVLNRYMTFSDVRALRSTTADMVDSWSMAKYGWSIELEGDEVQYFTHDLDNWGLKR